RAGEGRSSGGGGAGALRARRPPRAGAAAMPQPAPCSFNEAFERVLLDRTGVKMTRGKFVKEHMDKELQLARKVEGFAVEGGAKDEQIGGTSIVEGAQKAWSADSEELMGLVRPLGPRNPNLASEAFLKPFFRDLNLSGARGARRKV
ncbi:unnamed protein product, partial [Prorocentrum cordatum]